MAATPFRSFSRAWKASDRLVDPRHASTLSRKASMLWPLLPEKYTFHFVTIRPTSTMGKFHLLNDESSTPLEPRFSKISALENAPSSPQASLRLANGYLSPMYRLRGRGFVVSRIDRVITSMYLEVPCVPFFVSSGFRPSWCWMLFLALGLLFAKFFCIRFSQNPQMLPVP